MCVLWIRFFSFLFANIKEPLERVQSVKKKVEIKNYFEIFETLFEKSLLILEGGKNSRSHRPKIIFKCDEDAFLKSFCRWRNRSIIFQRNVNAKNMCTPRRLKKVKEFTAKIFSIHALERRIRNIFFLRVESTICINKQIKNKIKGSFVWFLYKKLFFSSSLEIFGVKLET